MHQLASYSHWPQPISDNTSNPFDSNLLVRRNSACLSPYKYLHNISKHSKTNCKTQIIYLGTLSAMTPFIPLYSFPTWQVHKQQCGKVVMSGCLVVQDLTKALPRHGGQIGDGESGLRSCCQLIVSHTELLSTLSSVCSGRSWQNSASFGALGACKCTSLNLAKIGPYVSPDICV